MVHHRNGVPTVMLVGKLFVLISLFVRSCMCSFLSKILAAMICYHHERLLYEKEVVKFGRHTVFVSSHPSMLSVSWSLWVIAFGVDVD